jgi:hypothetical protein
MSKGMRRDHHSLPTNAELVRRGLYVSVVDPPKMAIMKTTFQ